MAISLAVFAHHAEQGSVPPNLEKIWSILAERNLMPPGFEFQNGELLSPSGTILVRYQSEPLRFEILSRPKQDSTSPAILLRFPLTSLDGRTITYFQSASVNRFDIPAPFAPLEKIVSAGWTLEQWRGELVPKTKNPSNSRRRKTTFKSIKKSNNKEQKCMNQTATSIIETNRSELRYGDIYLFLNRKKDERL